MFKILEKQVLTPEIKLMVIDAPRVARKAKAGQFVILRINDQGERIPLTIADFDPKKGTVTIIFQEVGKTTMMLGEMEAGDTILDFVGPLGKEMEEKNFGHVVCVGGGVGIAPTFPKARALKEAGNKVTSIIGARTASMLFWEDKMREVSDKLYVTTDDGSYGEKGFVTTVLERVLEQEKVDLVIAVGPVMMMKMTSLLTKKHGVPTLVSLNPIMVDGTGMCGCCRVSVNGQCKFTCVDGPIFDGHAVDFDELLSRQRIYLEEEKRALEKYLATRAKEEAHYAE
ncbi:MAG: sulfide dehydrogenase subunit beta [Candidatus Atribacteria bacterium]|uniref:sulfide/dihydroorotate dehydrogenase-like FAD/NAD-binding protein n=1 Tax=Atrimonas thermophila TaxID=3064161 RepID=UPI0024AA9B98|nr:sulfide dehydrogenase subunit beta [Candidatus Atribacteria bacterium]